MAHRARRCAPSPSRYVKALTPYDAVSSLGKIASAKEGLPPLKLDWNESTIPPPPRVQQAILEFLLGKHPLNWYPDLSARALREALADYVGLPPDWILVTNGSDGALDLLCRTYLEPGDEVATIWPTYGHFIIFAKACGATVREVENEDCFSVHTESILRQVSPHAKVIYVASPNNPTGVVTPKEDVARICKAFPESLVIVDEAYFEFSGKTSASLVPEFENLVITRTFSKCFSIAAVRVGYLLANTGIVHELKKLHNPKSVNAIGQVAATAILQEREFRESFVQEVQTARESLVSALRARGAEVRSTEANFVLLRLANPKAFVQALESVSVYVRDRSEIRGFSGYVRITVGTKAQMEDLICRIDKLLESQPTLLEPPNK